MTTATRSIELAERTAGREWSIRRDFDAPRDLVFKVWTVPTLLARWWGPTGFTNPVCELDPRPGGAYRIVMRDPEGIEYPVKGVYREVVEPERLVMTDIWDEHPAEWHAVLRSLREGGAELSQEALNTVTFEDLGDGTRLTLRTLFESGAVRDAMVKMGMENGWSESFARLDELLARL